MNDQECDAAVDAIVETTAHEYFKAGRKGVESRLLTGIASDIAEPFMSTLRTELVKQSKDAVRLRDINRIDSLLSRYAADVRAAVVRAREGVLRPHEPADEIRRHSGQFAPKRYNPFDVGVLLKMLQPEERIELIDFREIRTSVRTITRAALRAYAGSAASQCSTERVIAAGLEAFNLAESRKRQYSAGPSEIIGRGF